MEGEKTGGREKVNIAIYLELRRTVVLEMGDDEGSNKS